jgi:hypothetical protein
MLSPFTPPPPPMKNSGFAPGTTQITGYKRPYFRTENKHVQWAATFKLTRNNV